jgi:hypothetical protein
LDRALVARATNTSFIVRQPLVEKLSEGDRLGLIKRSELCPALHIGFEPPRIAFREERLATVAPERIPPPDLVAPLAGTGEPPADRGH